MRDGSRWSIASRYRLSAAAPSATSARERAAAPSAQGVPLATARRVRRSAASCAISGRPQRDAASTSSWSDHDDVTMSSVAVAFCAASSAGSY